MVYLMPRHVAEEWRLVFDMTQRLQDKTKAAVASRGTDLLLPVSIAQVWAIEIISGGSSPVSNAMAPVHGSSMSASIPMPP